MRGAHEEKDRHPSFTWGMLFGLVCVIALFVITILFVFTQQTPNQVVFTPSNNQVVFTPITTTTTAAAAPQPLSTGLEQTVRDNLGGIHNALKALV